MNKDTRELVIAAEWFALALAFLWLAWGTFRLARDIDGPVSWPLAGRYLLAATALSLAVNALDIVRLRLEPAFLEPYWHSSGPDAASAPSVIVVRGISVFLVSWLAWRIRHGGLVRGRVSSAPESAGEIVFMRRKDDWEAEA